MYLFRARNISFIKNLEKRVIKELFTWREEDSSTRKIREGGKTFRLLYMQKFRPKWIPSEQGKEE